MWTVQILYVSNLPSVIHHMNPSGITAFGHILIFILYIFLYLLSSLKSFVRAEAARVRTCVRTRAQKFGRTRVTKKRRPCFDHIFRYQALSFRNRTLFRGRTYARTPVRPYARMPGRTPHANPHARTRARACTHARTRTRMRPCARTYARAHAVSVHVRMPPVLPRACPYTSDARASRRSGRMYRL